MALRNNPDAIKEMRTPNNDGSYSVLFPGGDGVSVTVSPAEYAQQPYNGPERPAQVSTHNDEIRMAETAYARWLKTRYPKRFKNADTTNIRSVFQQPAFDSEVFTIAFAYRVVTGRAMKARVKPDLPDYFHLSPNDQEQQVNHYAQKLRKDLAKFARHPEKLDIALVANPTPPQLYDPESRLQYVDVSKKILSYHVFIVEEVDLEKQRVLLKDPHNTRLGLMLPMEDIFSMFYKVYTSEKK